MFSEIWEKFSTDENLKMVDMDGRLIAIQSITLFLVCTMYVLYVCIIWLKPGVQCVKV